MKKNNQSDQNHLPADKKNPPLPNHNPDTNTNPKPDKSNPVNPKEDR